MILTIGVDFDNTLVCYDEVFHRIALENQLIAPDTPMRKQNIRDQIRNQGQENQWTEMQGYVYGERIKDAPPFPGVIDFFRLCQKARHRVFIISHKTKHPFIGPAYDLHKGALDWLDQTFAIANGAFGIRKEHIFLESTKQKKSERIALCHCDIFIDDLPEFLLDSYFPNTAKRILFDPHNECLDFQRFHLAGDWRKITHYFEQNLGHLCQPTK